MENSVGKLIKKSKSGILSISFYYHGEIISSGSGFIYKGYLISNSHVFNPNNQPLSPEVEVRLRFGDSSQHVDDISIAYQNLELVVGSHETSHDYSVYRFPADASIKGRHEFLLDHTIAYEGQKVLLLGYPFGVKFMTSHIGYVSAIYENAGVKKIQLDASVNLGNSGGPLLDITSGKVIGIVTRKSTGLVQEFDSLIQSFDNNIKALEGMRGIMGLGGIDPAEVLQVSQRQMQLISRSIKRSSNVGIGYAFSCHPLESEDL